MKPLLVAVMGPTASGKTALAEAIADELGAALINADNFCCYRHMDIGTAKPTARERYHLLDILEPNEPFGVGAWVDLASKIILEPPKETVLVPPCDVRAEGGTVGEGDSPAGRQSFVIVGGSGLNVRALFERYEGMSGPPPEGLRESLNARTLDDLVEELQRRAPELALATDLKNPIRVTRALERLDSPPKEPGPDLSEFRKVKLGLDVPVEWVNERIERRVGDMLEEGWLEEVDRIRQMGFAYDDPGLKAHGYRNLWDVLEGLKSLDQARQEIVTMVKQYAKRQRTWMRSERNLCKISAEDGRRAVSDALLLLLGE